MSKNFDIPYFKANFLEHVFVDNTRTDVRITTHSALNIASSSQQALQQQYYGSGAVLEIALSTHIQGQPD